MSSAPNKPGRSFAFRLNLWFALSMTSMALALFFAAYYLLSASIAQKDREIISVQLHLYRSWYEDVGLGGLSQRFASQVNSGRETFFVRVAGPGGAALFVNQPQGSGALNDAALVTLNATPQEWTRLPAGARSGPWLIATASLGDGHWLQVGKITEVHETLLEHFRLVSGVVLALGLTLGLLAGALITGRVLNPIRRLITAVKHVLSTGQMDARVPIGSGPGDELDELTALFNQMLAKNGSLLTGMREALDNVAHDLRTPLTRLRSSAERALANPPGPGDREAVSDAMEETEKVLMQLDTLMDISEAETGLMRLDKKNIPLATLAQDAIALYELVAEDRGITVHLDAPPEILAFADPQRLRQALVNLIDNALKYTPRGGTVTIFAAHTSDSSILGVRDTGPGIPEEDMPRIWDRLYRGDKSRSARGLGLGLSLVKAIAEAHGGKAEVESSPSTGTTFRIWIPARPA
jgi:signal transduction histidine kinase